MLDLDECRGLSAGDLLIALTGLKQLRSVCLNGIPEVSDTLLAAVAQALPLTEVNISTRLPSPESRLRDSYCRDFILIPCAQQLGPIPGLGLSHTLSIDIQCRRSATLLERQLSNPVVLVDPGQRPQVSVSYCASVTDAGVAALAAACPQLEVLRLDEVSKVTDVGVATVAASCKRLRVRALIPLFCTSGSPWVVNNSW